MTLFTSLTPDQTGVDFVNPIDNSDSISILNYIYYYNGGGVGVADFNNDGLPDLFFSGNRADDEIYFNMGALTFEKRTLEAGIHSNGWSTGVSIIDIDQDGWLDIYVCRAGGFKDPQLRANVLYMNQRDGTFQEVALDLGIADTANSTHSLFLDYDRDGDLDLYVMNHGNERSRVNTPIPLTRDGSDPSTDHLYRNDDGLFQDVSREAGIVHEGYGLGLASSDINHDGWPDIYVANDFIFSDLIYINNGDGTFSEEARQRLGHQSYNSMGCDFGDINNDGYLDLITLDMLPPDNARQKTMMGAMNYNKYIQIINNGYAHQYMRNMLQLNLPEVGFKEIGRYAGVEATDWSWTPLLADFDLDGYTDLFISNGYYKDITDKDFIKYSQNITMFQSQERVDSTLRASLDQLREVHLPNFVFGNTGSVRFDDKTTAWLPTELTLSGSAVYADLDLDGDLDIVTNNINAPPGIYQNGTTDAGYAKIKLETASKNRHAVGSLLQLYTNSGIMTRQWQPSRGFQGSIHEPIHFGLGSATKIDSLRITWPDGRISVHTDIDKNKINRIEQPESAIPVLAAVPQAKTISLPSLDFVHKEDRFADFHIQNLIPAKMSHEGPALAVGDLNGDGQDDLFVGGARDQPSSVYYQTSRGFERQSLPNNPIYEDTDAEIIDVNGDGRNDLIVARGGYDHLQVGLFVTQADGTLLDASDRIPEVEISSAVIRTADMDQDGDLDIFLAGRFLPGRYPESPESVLLHNMGGSFEVADGWPRELGMITDARWADLSEDGFKDLILVGEWMPLSVLENRNGQLMGIKALSSELGMWQAVHVIDVDKDGDQDFVAGNMGLNNHFHVSSKNPLELLAADFDGNGSVDPIMIKTYPDGRFPIAPRDALVGQIPAIQNRIMRYHAYAQSTHTELFTENELRPATHLFANELRSGLFLNTHDSITFVPLPDRAQWGPIKSILEFETPNGPGLVLTGNDYQIEVLEGRQDALSGLVYAPNKSGQYSIHEVFHTMDVRKSASLIKGTESYWVFGQNNDSLLVIPASRFQVLSVPEQGSESRVEID